MALTAQKFQQAAQSQDPAAFDYEAEVAQVWHDFPQTKGHIFFVDLGEGGKPVCPGTAGEKDEALQNLNQEWAQECMRKHGKSSFKGADPEDILRLTIFLFTGKHPGDVIDKAAPVAQETAFAFDHELAHIIALDWDIISDPDLRGLAKSTLEAWADAYAMILHFQRFGADSPNIDALVANRAYHFVFMEDEEGRSHFTSPVTEAILAQRDKINWNDLTPEQTVQKAQDFVREHQLKAEAFNAIDDEFRPFHDMGQAVVDGDAAPVRELAEKLLATHSVRVFKYGMMALQVCLENEKTTAALKGTDWDDVQSKLADKQKTFVPPKSVPTAKISCMAM